MDCFILDDSILLGYSNVDYGGDPDERKSTLGYMFTVGLVELPWSSKTHPVVVLSTCEA